MEINWSSFPVIVVGKIILRMDTVREADSWDGVLYGEKWKIAKPVGKPKKTHLIKKRARTLLFILI